MVLKQATGIELLSVLLQAEQKKVVIMGHSLGTRCLYYFLKWANGTKVHTTRI